jgi:hypothetical protein
MSLKLVKQQLKSPFQLQRSIVPRDESGAYERGGYDPDNVYSDGGAAAAITSVGNSITAGINSLTPGDINKMNENKAARLERRSAKTESKMEAAKAAGNTKKADRMQKRNTRVENRLNETNKKIEEYNESTNPTLKSDIKPISSKTTTPSASLKSEKTIANLPAKKPVSAVAGGDINGLSYKNNLQDLTDFNSGILQKKKKKY